jgi:hypothetical protein
MEAQQGTAQHLLAAQQMVQIGPTVLTASQTRATGIEGAVVVTETGIAKIPALPAHQG